LDSGPAPSHAPPTGAFAYDSSSKSSKAAAEAAEAAAAAEASLFVMQAVNFQ